MRCLLPLALLATLMGCGHSTQDTIATQNLKDEIRALQDSAESSEKSAQEWLKHKRKGFNEKKYVKEHPTKYLTGEPTEDDIAKARKAHEEIFQKWADNDLSWAAKYRQQAEAKRKLLR